MAHKHGRKHSYAVASYLLLFFFFSSESKADALNGQCLTEAINNKFLLKSFPPSDTVKYRLTVVNGYGSGNFHAGDTVYIFANASSADSVFAGWGASIKAIRFDDGREWHTTFVMLGTDITVYAGFQPMPPGAYTSERIHGRDVTKDVRHAIPLQPRGIIIACHGTNGSGATWFTNPENVQFTRDAVANGYGVVATDAEEVTIGDQNGDGKLRWLNRVVTDNVDVANIRAILDTLRNRGLFEASTPLFVMGMSAGGSFAPTLGLQIGARATATYCAEGLSGVIAATTIPQIWNNAIWDDNDEVDNAAASVSYQLLLQRGIPTEFHFHDRSPIYHERFLRVSGITEQTALALYADLMNNNLLDSVSFLRMSTSDTLLARIARAPQLFPAVLSITPAQRADVLDQIRCSLANHQFFSDRNYSTLRFFERFLEPTGVKRTQLPSSPHINIFPNPSASFITIRSEIPISARITDLLGREMWRGRIDQNANVDTSFWMRCVFLLFTKILVTKFVCY